MLEVSKLGMWKLAKIKPDATATYQTTDFSFYKNSFEVNKLEVASGSAFKNAANGEFYLKNSILEKEKAGDPRWIK